MARADFLLGLLFLLAEAQGQSRNELSGEAVKRFKTSPFAWSNPLSGYSVVLVKLPGEQPQIQVVRNKENPYSRMRSSLLPGSGARGGQRGNYVIKWLDGRKVLAQNADESASLSTAMPAADLQLGSVSGGAGRRIRDLSTLFKRQARKRMRKGEDGSSDEGWIGRMNPMGNAFDAYFGGR